MAVGKKRPTDAAAKVGGRSTNGPDERTTKLKGELPAIVKAAGARTVRPSRTPSQRPRKQIKVAAPKAAASDDRKLDALLTELRSLTGLVRQLVPPPAGADGALEESVDSVRRLLSELIEQRMESVVRDLADARRLAAAPATDPRQSVERLDAILDRLGAMQFAAEAMDVVDPLIHVVVEERSDTAAPDGVILESVAPGYRTARGLVVAKASVVVNRRG